MDKYTKDWYWLNEHSTDFLRNGYIPAEKDIKKHFKQFAAKVERLSLLPQVKEKVYDYIAKGYYLIPTPGITNFTDTKESPVSCFNSHVPDSVEGLLYSDAEIGMMSKIGGGTSAYLGAIRSKGSPITGGGHADGVMRYIRRLQDTTGYINQKSRRGKVAVYLDFVHPEIEDFLTIQDKTSLIQEVPFGVCISDNDIKNIREGDSKARTIWAKIIKKKFEKGFPYIFFTDTVNNNKPKCYANHPIRSSNLCTEILQPSNDDWSFTCVILALNMFHKDEFPEDVVFVAFCIMDAFVTDFINKNEGNPLLTRAVEFAKQNRSVGLGASGWHSYLQRNNIALESMEAKLKNVQVFKWLQEQSMIATSKLAQMLGNAPVCEGLSQRNATLNALAPNTSSSEIFGQWSQSIEPNYSNAYIKALAKTKRMHKNCLLEDLLESKGLNTDEIWDDIILHNGSVQHLSILTDHEKAVYKIFEEISPMELLIQNSQRQKFIDQGISFNTMIPSGTPAKDVSNLYLKAHELGIKTLYYQLNQNSAQVQTRKNILECVSCAG